MTGSRKHHANFVFVAIVYAQLVFNRATGLNNMGYSSISCNFYAVRKREKASEAMTAPERSKLKLSAL